MNNKKINLVLFGSYFYKQLKTILLTQKNQLYLFNNKLYTALINYSVNKVWIKNKTPKVIKTSAKLKKGKAIKLK